MSVRTIYDTYPERFYLLSTRCRKLISLESQDHFLEEEVEKAFAKLPIVEGGNIYALYKYDSSVKVTMDELSKRFKSQYPQVQQLSAYFKDFVDGDYFIKHNSAAPLSDLKRTIIKLWSKSLLT